MLFCKSPNADEPQDLVPAARGQPRVVDARVEVSVRSMTPRAGLTTTTRRRGRGSPARDVEYLDGGAAGFGQLEPEAHIIVDGLGPGEGELADYWGHDRRAP